MNITRIAKGKVQDVSVDKEFEHILPQMEKTFNDLKSNIETFQTKLSRVDVSTATVGDLVTLLLNFTKDLKNKL